MDDLFDTIARMPFSQKVLAVLAIVVAVSAGNYYLLVKPVQEQKVQLDQQYATLQTQLATKQRLAKDLAKYRADVERLKQRLQEALALLPNQSEIPELLQKIANLGTQSGLELAKFQPQPEVKGEFYASVPVKMEILGNFHEIAVFFDKISKLSRIVNISDIALSEPKVVNKKVVLTSNCLATTFRFLEPEEVAQKGGKKRAPRKGK